MKNIEKNDYCKIDKKKLILLITSMLIIVSIVISSIFAINMHYIKKVVFVAIIDMFLIFILLFLSFFLFNIIGSKCEITKDRIIIKNGILGSLDVNPKDIIGAFAYSKRILVIQKDHLNFNIFLNISDPYAVADLINSLSVEIVPVNSFSTDREMIDDMGDIFDFSDNNYKGIIIGFTIILVGFLYNVINAIFKCWNYNVMTDKGLAYLLSLFILVCFFTYYCFLIFKNKICNETDRFGYRNFITYYYDLPIDNVCCVYANTTYKKRICIRCEDDNSYSYSTEKIEGHDAVLCKVKKGYNSIKEILSEISKKDNYLRITSI